MLDALVTVCIYALAVAALFLALLVVGPSLIRAGLALFDVDDEADSTPDPIDPRRI